MTDQPEPILWLALHGGRGSVVHAVVKNTVAACGRAPLWFEPEGNRWAAADKPKCRRCVRHLEKEADHA